MNTPLLKLMSIQKPCQANATRATIPIAVYLG